MVTIYGGNAIGRCAEPHEAHRRYQAAKLAVGERLYDAYLNRVDSRAMASMRTILDKLSDDLEAGRETHSLHPINLPEKYKQMIKDQLSNLL